MGGVGPIPWAEIEENIREGREDWIEKSRLPDPSVAPFKEPGRLKLAECLAWLSFLSKRQNGDPEAELFQFKQVYAGAKPPPSWSAALEPCEKVQRGSNHVYLLKYEPYVQKSQAVAGIAYPKNTWIWLAHLNGQDEPLGNWKGLPPRVETDNSVEALIGEEERASIKKMFSNAWDEVGELIEELIDRVNVAESLGPASVSACILFYLSDTRCRTVY